METNSVLHKEEKSMTSIERTKELVTLTFTKPISLDEYIARVIYLKNQYY